MEKSVLKAIKDFNLLPNENTTVTVALSGGADSMSLLHCLVDLKEQLNINIEAAHFNHQIRGDEAIRDQNFVIETCKKIGVKLHLKSEDVPLYAKQNKLSLELAARQLRYNFFKEINKGVIATAHNAGDNLETMLFNLARGTGMDGLCGIPPKRDIFIRPLLLCTRDEIEEYCQTNNISYVTDSTNLSDDYTRNKIRHKIITVLREINPSVDNSAIRTALSLREDRQFLNGVAEEYILNNKTEKGLILNDFQNISPSVAKRIIKLYVENEFNINLESVHINSVYQTVLEGGRVGIPQNYTVESKNNLFRVFKIEDPKINYLIDFNTINQINYKNVNNLFLNSLIDCDKIIGKLVVRTRLAGDSLRLCKSGCTKTLSKHFNELNIPFEQRDIIPVVADDLGVVWVYGVGVAQRCCVNEKTKNAMEIIVQMKEVQF